ncbi:hypothetical protein CyaNS01_00791 [Cyanobium sp. NS01]|nr:hypothetical protein CyaNS01_00791 [Cyanobium sp. NS01]
MSQTGFSLDLIDAGQKVQDSLGLFLPLRLATRRTTPPDQPA